MDNIVNNMWSFIDEVKDEIEGTHKLTNIVTDEFMATNTKYASLQELVDSFGKLENATDINNCPEFNHFISENTKFSSFQDILQNAAIEMIRKKFGT